MKILVSEHKIKKAKSICLSSFLSMSLFFGTPALITVTYSPQVSAAGIPTIDVAALVQKLLEYVQQLNDFSEQLYQSKVIANEYIQTLKDMEQTYKEYEHTLEEIKGIADYIEEAEWEEILDRIDIDFPLDPFDSHWDDWGVSILTDDGVIDIDQKISRVYKRIRPINQVEQDIDTLFNDPDVRDQKKAEARAQYKKSREVTEQKYSAAVFERHGDLLEETEMNLMQDRHEVATGDESELRSIQFLAAQQELALRYQAIQNKILVKSLEMDNQEAVERKTKESYIYDQHLLNQLETETKSSYTINPTRRRTVDF